MEFFVEPTSSSSPYQNYFNLDDDKDTDDKDTDDTEIEIKSSKPPEPESEKVKDVEEKKKTDPVDAEKKPENKNDKLTKKATQRDWITIVVTTSAVAMGIFALLATSFLLASIFTGGLTLVGIIVPLSLAVVGFSGCVLTLTLLKKITNVLDDACTKLFEFFKKKPPVPEKEQVSIK